MDHQILDDYNALHYGEAAPEGLDEELKVLYDITGSTPELKIDEDQAWQALRSNLSSPTIQRSFPNNYWLRVAAILVLGTFLGLATYFYSDNTTATNNRLVTIENPSSGTKTHLLPDGSQVWLRKGAVLTYSASFDERSVHFSGEGYFSVEKGMGEFSVETSDDLEIRVLGTEFGVNTKSANTVVRVTEGTVALSHDDSSQELTAGETGLYYRAKGRILKSTEDQTNALSWKTGHFKFENLPLREAVSLLQNFYPTEIILSTSSLDNCRVNGEFKNKSLNDILVDLSLVLSIEVKTTDNSFVLSGEGC